MSAELFEKFREDIERDDGIRTKSKAKKQISRNVDIAQRILNAANRGQVELAEDEQFLVEKKSKKKRAQNTGVNLNLKHAHQGFSLIDQVRAEKPKDLLNRNIKYMKYTEKRKLDEKKVVNMMKTHYFSLKKKQIVRRDREKLTCLREPKKTSNKKSVFSQKDFKNIGAYEKVTKFKQDENGTFL